MDIVLYFGVKHLIMFLQLRHTKLTIYQCTQALVQECYKITTTFPQEERFGMIAQIRRAALSVHLNLSEGASRNSPAERKRFFEISRGSVIEIDAALDIAYELNYIQIHHVQNLGNCILNTFKLLSGMIGSSEAA